MTGAPPAAASATSGCRRRAMTPSMQGGRFRWAVHHAPCLSELEFLFSFIIYQGFVFSYCVRGPFDRMTVGPVPAPSSTRAGRQMLAFSSDFVLSFCTGCSTSHVACHDRDERYFPSVSVSRIIPCLNFSWSVSTSCHTSTACMQQRIIRSIYIVP